MWKVTAIGEQKDLDAYKASLKFSEFEVRFVDKDQFVKKDMDDDLALIVFPWEGYREIFGTSNFKKYADQRSVVVVGPAIYFFEVEEQVIDGSLCFLSSPVNSIQIEGVINDIRRVRGENLTGTSGKKMRQSA